MERLWRGQGIVLYFGVLAGVSLLAGIIAMIVFGSGLIGLLAGLGILLIGTIFWAAIRAIGADKVFESARDGIGAAFLIFWHVGVILLIASGLLLGIVGGFSATMNGGALQFVRNTITMLDSLGIYLGYGSTSAQTAGLIMANIGLVAAFVGCYLSFPLDKRNEGVMRSSYTGLFDLLDRGRGNPRPEEAVATLPDTVIRRDTSGNVIRGGEITVRLRRDDERIANHWPGLGNTRFWNDVFIPLGYVVVAIGLLLGFIGLAAGVASLLGALVMEILYGALFYALTNRSYYRHNPHLEGEHGHAKHAGDRAIYDPDAKLKREELKPMKTGSLVWVLVMSVILGIVALRDYNRVSTPVADQDACLALRKELHLREQALLEVTNDDLDINGVFDPLATRGYCWEAQGMKTSLCRSLLLQCHPKWQGYTPEAAEAEFSAIIASMERSLAHRSP